MIPTHARDAIAHLPLLVDTTPQDCLLVAAWDTSGSLRHRHTFALDSRRPLDEPLLESSLWRDDVCQVATVLYGGSPRPDLSPLLSAWRYRGRSVVAAAWSGPTRWLDLTCQSIECCRSGGHAYNAAPAAHPERHSLPGPSLANGGWRRSQWRRWESAGAAGVAPPDPVDMCRLIDSLHDIPVRDAVLAHSADPQRRVGIRGTLQALADRAPLGTAVPLHTCLAALHYLDDDLEKARQRVTAVLDVEEYSLARLLHNGLEMRAPASLLARSFAHFTPAQLLAA